MVDFGKLLKAKRERDRTAVPFDGSGADEPKPRHAPRITFDEDQKRAIELALAGRNVFLTGAGGVGKSVVMRAIVRELREAGRSVAVTASTGVAAVNVGGTTIHSFLKTGLAANVNMIKHFGPDKLEETQKRIGHVDTIVVDEISMLTGDYLDMMQQWLSLVKDAPLAQYIPFGGFQVILVGDFLQLPAVIKDVPARKKFAFQASAWERGEFEFVHLTKVYRQEDVEMQQHLAAVRFGTASAETMAYFNARVGAKLEDDEPIRLFSHNADADEVNDARLDALEGDPVVYEATTDGHPKWQEAIRTSAPCEEFLLLKKGARVIFTRNNWREKFHNGLRGYVTDCSEDGVWVETDDGRRIQVPLETWEMRDASRHVLASITQLPLRCAWALTIHKSQGMTLDSLEVDLSKVFERGQAYVAVSRVRTIEGLRLLKRVSRMAFMAAPVVTKFYRQTFGEEEK